MRSWCLRGSNLTAKKSVPAARSPHRIVKFTSTRLPVPGLHVNRGRSQAGKPEAICKAGKIQHPTLKKPDKCIPILVEGWMHV